MFNPTLYFWFEYIHLRQVGVDQQSLPFRCKKSWSKKWTLSVFTENLSPLILCILINPKLLDGLHRWSCSISRSYVTDLQVSLSNLIRFALCSLLIGIPVEFSCSLRCVSSRSRRIRLLACCGSCSELHHVRIRTFISHALHVVIERISCARSTFAFNIIRKILLNNNCCGDIISYLLLFLKSWWYQVITISY